MRRKFEKTFNKITYVLEMFLGVLIGIGVVLGIGNLFKYFPVILSTDLVESYELFKNYLAYAFILIVGIELILLILNHSILSILNLMLFIIARKMLIYADTMLDLVFGSLAIAIIFATVKYLTSSDDTDVLKRERDKGVYSASTKLEEVFADTGFDIPIDNVQTVGGLVCNLAEEACKPVEQGSKFETGDLVIEVVKATDEGLIEEVKIAKK